MEHNHNHDENYAEQVEKGNIAEAHHPSFGVNVLVWIGLLSLTSITVAVAGINLGNLALSVALIIAIVKSFFVINFFMHVKFDNKLFKIFIGICILILIVILVLTFFDLTFRY